MKWQVLSRDIVSSISKRSLRPFTFRELTGLPLVIEICRYDTQIALFELMRSVASFRPILYGKALSRICGLRKRSRLDRVTLHFASFGTEAPRQEKKQRSDREKHPQEPGDKVTVFHFEDFYGQIRSLPNLITLARVGSTPLISYWIVTSQFEYAVVGCLLAGVSDAVDGYLARNHGMATVLGSYLDPLADKLMVNTVAISLWYSDCGTILIPTPLVALWLLKDSVLVTATLWTLSELKEDDPLTIQPATVAKVNTVLQFATLGVAMIHPIVSTPEILLPTLWWVTGGTTVTAAASYVAQSGFVRRQ